MKLNEPHKLILILNSQPQCQMPQVSNTRRQKQIHANNVSCTVVETLVSNNTPYIIMTCHIVPTQFLVHKTLLLVLALFHQQSTEEEWNMDALTNNRLTVLKWLTYLFHTYTCAVNSASIQTSIRLMSPQINTSRLCPCYQSRRSTDAHRSVNDRTALTLFQLSLVT